MSATVVGTLLAPTSHRELQRRLIVTYRWLRLLLLARSAVLAVAAPALLGSRPFVAYALVLLVSLLISLSRSFDVQRAATVWGWVLSALVSLLANGVLRVSPAITAVVIATAILYDVRVAVRLVTAVGIAMVMMTVVVTTGHWTYPQQVQTFGASFAEAADLSFVAMYLGANLLVMRWVLEALQRSQEEQGAALAHERTLREQLAHAERQFVTVRQRELVGIVAAGMLHDLRNRLQLTMMESEYLAEALTGPARESALRALEGVEEATALMVEVVQAMRPPEAHRSSCDLQTVLQRTGAHARRILPPRIAYRARVHGSARLPLSAVQLEQALLNLVLNARDALADGGEVVVTAAVATPPGAVTIEVTDNGIGIPEEQMSRLFVPFESSKGEAGTGLGLFMIRRTVEAVGGDVVVTSAVGEGTRVRLTIPMLPFNAAPPHRAPAEGDNSSAADESSAATDG